VKEPDAELEIVTCVVDHDGLVAMYDTSPTKRSAVVRLSEYNQGRESRGAVRMVYEMGDGMLEAQVDGESRAEQRQAENEWSRERAEMKGGRQFAEKAGRSACMTLSKVGL
jgi:hypothetical protein